MKNIFKKIKISNYTYFFIIICILCGYIKNITIIFTICFIHELGHIFFIKLFSYEIISIELFPFGGYTQINKQINTSINKDLIIATAGILAQIILGFIIYLFQNNFQQITYTLLVKYNLIIMFFNLIPIIPLDGNNIIHLFLEKIFPYNLSYKINLGISLFFLLIFFYLNYKLNLDNYLIISFLIYKIIMAFKNYKYFKNRFLLERYLYNFNYQKIDNHTKDISNLRKNVLHYFKEGNHYVKEKDKIAKYFKKKPTLFDK